MIFKIKQKRTFCDFVGKEKIKAKKEKKGHFRSVWYISAIDAAQLPREFGFFFFKSCLWSKTIQKPSIFKPHRTVYKLARTLPLDLNTNNTF